MDRALVEQTDRKVIKQIEKMAMRDLAMLHRPKKQYLAGLHPKSIPTGSGWRDRAVAWFFKYFRLFPRYYWRDSLWFVIFSLELPKTHLFRRLLADEKTLQEILRAFAKQIANTPKPLTWQDVIVWPPWLYQRLFMNAESGKGPHETPRNIFDRMWLKVRLGFVRGHPYYGSIDSTLLWVIALHEYVYTTDDTALLDELAEPLEQAIEWIERSIKEGGGFVRYDKRRWWAFSHHKHQGWRDGFGKRGLDVFGITYPIALVDVQGYAYRALKSTGRHEAEAKKLRRRIIDAFWMRKEETFALAINGNNERVEKVTSDAAHLLWAQVLDPDEDDAAEFAAQVAKRRQGLIDSLFDPHRLWTAYGMRTLSIQHDPPFAELGYHMGAIWLFELMIIALGLIRVGAFEEARRVLKAMVEAVKADERISEVHAATKGGTFLSMKRAGCPQLWSATAMLVCCSKILEALERK